MIFFGRITRARFHRVLPPTLTAETIDHVIAVAAADPSLHPTSEVVRFLAETGLRFKELCRLRTEDVDIESRRLFVACETARGRYIPLTPHALNALQSLHESFLGSAFVLGDKAELVLHRVSQNFKRIATQVGASGNRLHSLRRFYAKRLIADGIDPLLIARQIGSQDPRLTIFRY